MISKTSLPANSESKIISKPLTWMNSRPDYFHISAPYNLDEQRRILANQAQSEIMNFLSFPMSLHNPPTSSTAHETPLFHFNRAILVPGVSQGHFQLHHLMKAVSNCQVLVSCKTGVRLVNTLTGKSTEIIAGDGNKSVDYDPATAMVVATPKDQVLIRNLQTPGKPKVLRFFDDDEVISRAVFLPNCRGRTDLVAVGNSRDCIAMDLGKLFKRTLFRCTENTNSIDFNSVLGIYALAEDDPAIELKDERDQPLVGFLRGHTDSNFACAFISDFGLATAGQDCIVRIWDLRFPARSLHHFKHKSTVYSMCFNRESNRLFVAERMARMISYSLKDIVPLVSVFDFVGPTTGLAVSDSGDKAWVGVTQSGVIETDIIEP